MEALIHKKTYWQSQMDKIANKVDSIEKITAHLENGTPPTKIHELTEEERAWFLAKMACVEDLHGQRVLSEAVALRKFGGWVFGVNRYRKKVCSHSGFGM